MMAFTQTQGVARLTFGTCAADRRRPSAARPRVVMMAGRESSNNKGQSGIHDPIGWGQRGGAVKSHEAGLEQQRHLQAQALSGVQERSSQSTHPPSGAGVGKYEAAQREILEVEKEKAVMREQSASDDEYAHMSQPAKWWMELKALLYSWLRTGVEPL